MNWAAIIPRKIVAESSARHIQSVLEDAQSTIARLTAERQELVEALQLADATLRGANMDVAHVEKKVAAALAKVQP